MAQGFRDPLGGGLITASVGDADGFYALRTFMKPDTDEPANPLGPRHLAADWNADKDTNEQAYATYAGTVAYVSADAGENRGGVVMLNHTLPDGRKFTTTTMHLSNIPIEILNGTRKPVLRDEFLGQSGIVKEGWGLHVHYEVRVGHQSGLAGVGFGYYGGTGQGVLVSSGADKGVRYADIRNPDGAIVRYLDPIDFTNAMRTIPDPPNSKPDFNITAKLQDASLSWGQALTVSMSIGNVGSASGSGKVTLFWSSDTSFSKNGDTALGTVDFGPVSPNGGKASTTATIDFSKLAGLPSFKTGYVFAVVDADNLVSEVTKNNNVAKVMKFTMPAGQPDLAVVSAKAVDASLAFGQDLEISVQVKNMGSVGAEGKTTAYTNSRGSVPMRPITHSD